MPKVLFVVAHEGFQPVEYGDPKNILQNNGVEVFTTSNLLGIAKAAYNEDEAKVDTLVKDVDVLEYDGIFFVGGPGALVDLNNEESYGLIRQMSESGKLWGAICISPRILAQAGVLKGKRVTGWDDDGELGEILFKAQAEYVRDLVVVDGKLITASGPKAAAEWGRKILENL